MAAAPRYDRIGHGYAQRRNEDPGLRQRIATVVGNSKSVLNVGAGAGSYEPDGPNVIALEPSAVMIGQRKDRGPAVRGVAGALPLLSQSVDAAMSVLSLHHWHPHQERGIREICRVTRGPIAIATVDAEVSARMWLMADYFPEVRDLDLEIFPQLETLASYLDRPFEIDVVPISRDTPDHSLMSFWAHPERVLDPQARAVTSGFARQPQAVVDRVVREVERDLASGAWDDRHGELRSLSAFDAGLRLLRAWPA